MSNDKYILNEISKKLSRYNSTEKLFMCSYLSYCSIDYFKRFRETGKIPPYYEQPWNVGTFILFVLYLTAPLSKIQRKTLSKEWYQDIDFIFRIIYKQFPNNYESLLSSGNAESVLYSYFNQQAFYETDIRLLCFRYYSIISYNENIKKAFINFSGSQYLDFCVLGSLFYYFSFLVGGDHSLKSYKQYISLINGILKIKHPCIEILSTKRNDFISLQNNAFDSTKLSSYYSCYKEFSVTPFFRDDKSYYLIAPHCVAYACTEGIFKRFVYCNKKLKDNDISESFEYYLYKLILSSKIYETKNIKWGKNEEPYIVNKNKVKPEDVVVKNGETILFFECKINTPKTLAFNNDLEAINNEKRKLLEGTLQLLKSYRNYKNNKYKPFNESSKDAYLILVTFYNLFISSETIINELQNNSSYELTEEEIDFLKHHLFICDIICIESYYLYSVDLTHDLKEFGQKEKLNELHSCRTALKSTSKEYDDFKKMTSKEFESLKKYLVEK